MQIFQIFKLPFYNLNDIIMKLQINQYILFFVTLCVTGELLSQSPRRVSWLHGLGENSTSWNYMESIFESERNIFGSSPGYNDEDGISAAALDAKSFIGNDSNGIVIGHSMGGNVARAIDIDDPGIMGGIITVGTPNDGAFISNSLINGSVENAVEDACEDLLAGPLSEIPILSLVVNNLLADFVCGVLYELIVEPKLGSNINQSAVDLAVGSPALPGATSGIPTISIWGNERSPVHWRLLSSLESNNANDTEWIENAEDFREVYNSFYQGHLAASIISGVFGFFSPWSWGVSGREAYVASQWRRGVNWFDGSEGIWNELIDCGGTREEEVSITYDFAPYWSFCSCFSTGSEDWVECVENYCPNGIENCIQEISYTILVPVNKASDGFICKDSQIGSVQIDEYEAKDANHSEELVHSNIRARIDDIFDRTDFFGTP